ncbi:hypothetical protein V0288_00700 [Pannus brasiliensis CCIBt3594]|uniref:Type II secretion system protein n=1 Tax=Pannus brasiliensis CCIBt3594 TaxID=1427578 RepID=A0AAW9QKH9_9CHRO
MRLYLEYILSIHRPSKIPTRRQLRTGFTLIELVVAAFCMLFVVSIAGSGLVNLMRNNYKANADSDQRNSLQRALELMSNEIRRAKVIAASTNDIQSTQTFDWSKDANKKPILAFRITDPDDPTRAISQQIIYYVQKGDNQWNNSSNSPVLWRYGPPVDSEGNYKDLEDTGQWKATPLVFGLQDAILEESKLDCDLYRDSPDLQKEWQRFPAFNTSDPVPGMYACVKKVDGTSAQNYGTQVVLVASTETKLAMGDSSSLTLSSKVSAPAEDRSYIISQSKTNLPASATVKIQQGNDVLRIIPVQESYVIPKLIEGKCDSVCQYDVGGNYDELVGFDTIKTAPANSDIVVYLGGTDSISGNVGGVQKVSAYTRDNPPPSSVNFSRPLTNEEVLLVVTDLQVTPNQTYVVLLTIKPTT